MAKTKSKGLQTPYPKPKTSLFLFCSCFGSLPTKNVDYSSDPIPKQKSSSWFSWPRIRIIKKKNSATKTVPLHDASLSVSKQKLQSKSGAKKANYSISKSRSKSTMHKFQTPAINPPPPRHLPPVYPAAPNQTSSQTRYGANNADDTRQESRASPTHPKRQARRQSSTMLTQTTSKKARNAYDPLVGMSVIMVTLVIMIFWGRLCAILCTSAWLYYIPRFKTTVENENDENDYSNKNSNNLDLDSEGYKKKVIMGGFLDRSHRSLL